MTFKEHLGVKGDECQCGRRATIRHCPACGSTRIYSRLNRFHKHLNGELRLVEVQFRCQRCSHLFIDEERDPCQAPPLGVALAMQRVKALYEAGQTGEYLRPGDQKIADALKELIVPPTTQTPEDKEKAQKLLVFRIQTEYVDNIASDAAKNDLTFQEYKDSGKVKESMEEYVTRRLTELGVESPELGAQKQPTVESQEPKHKPSALEQFEADAEAEREKKSVAVRTLEHEWARLSLAGRKPTATVEEFVQRRLAGEIFS